MTTMTFQTPVMLKKLAGGVAELALPAALQDLDCRFVVVKEGGEEAIVVVDAEASRLAEIVAAGECRKLTARQAEALRNTYDTPRLKQRLRADRAPGTDAAAPGFETLQTVRSGPYLIDVPIIPAV